MRNVDRIRVLENQLEHELNQVKKLREENVLLKRANTQISQMCDAVIIGIVQRYGEKRQDDDGKLWGYRLPTTKVDVKANVEAWEIFVEDQGSDRVIGISPKEAKQHGNER
ncbi:MAG: hypothetical protein VB078_06965 [Clostridiaceae bacterium]|nr:hypothetical protein [Clostridiaceae bacterium]